VPAEFANVLTGNDGGLPTRQTHLMLQNGRIRTFNHLEWERLQGFPDGWTDTMPNSARFKALGNAMHTGTSYWLARRLLLVNNAIPYHGERFLQLAKAV